MVHLVVKVGGGLLAHDGCFESVLEQIAIASQHVSLLIVPGGGPFADAVREVDRQVGLADDAAHWMAILAMDQYAQLITSRLSNGRLVTTLREVEVAFGEGRLPVLAPYQWMRESDPLPHSWDVTSDSIAAWIAGQAGADRLVLVKPSGASGPDVVDPCFHNVLPPHITTEIVTADRFVADRFVAASREARRPIT